MRSLVVRAIVGQVLAVTGIAGCANNDAFFARPAIDSTLNVCITSSVTPGSATLHVSDTTRFTAMSCGVGAKDWRWRMSDTAVATVDALSGLVRAKAVGVASVVAADVADTSIMVAGIVSVVP